MGKVALHLPSVVDKSNEMQMDPLNTIPLQGYLAHPTVGLFLKDSTVGICLRPLLVRAPYSRTMPKGLWWT